MDEKQLELEILMLKRDLQKRFPNHIDRVEIAECVDTFRKRILKPQASELLSDAEKSRSAVCFCEPRNVSDIFSPRQEMDREGNCIRCGKSFYY